MQPRCKGICFNEKMKRIKARPFYDDVEKYKAFFPRIPRTCNECNYAKFTADIRCYCCKNAYSTTPKGNSRRGTIEVMIKCREAARI